MTRLAWLLPAPFAVLALATCSVYGPDLVGSGGATTTSTSSSTPTGSGGGTSCTDVSQCPAMTTECQKPSCQGGFCRIDYTTQGTALKAQTAGDCQKVVCD